MAGAACTFLVWQPAHSTFLIRQAATRMTREPMRRCCSAATCIVSTIHFHASHASESELESWKKRIAATTIRRFSEKCLPSICLLSTRCWCQNI